MDDHDPASHPLEARMLRALGHPLRMRMLELLRAEGPATATGLGKQVEESSGTTSWHLRLLAEAGLVEEDSERGNKRERWWKATLAPAAGNEVPLFLTPEEVAAMSAEVGAVLDRYRRAARPGDRTVIARWTTLSLEPQPESR
ncbi:helix-turn-helix domain-containing protein [Amycolatopsis sp. NPDC098790]|uniref:helix-turn-helix domain-containing protein n=1 Tax=Amycolatopsis sp. NPDC098790 TaxID=3363939 RepID=UPI003802AB48